jgi:hypothetical protein
MHQYKVKCECGLVKVGVVIAHMCARTMHALLTTVSIPP